MSDTTTTLATNLAADTMKAMDELGNDRLYIEVAEVLGAASQTLEEAYLTEIRVRMAERKGRQFLIEKVAGHRTKRKAAEKQ